MAAGLMKVTELGEAEKLMTNCFTLVTVRVVVGHEESPSIAEYQLEVVTHRTESLNLSLSLCPAGSDPCSPFGYHDDDEDEDEDEDEVTLFSDCCDMQGGTPP